MKILLSILLIITSNFDLLEVDTLSVDTTSVIVEESLPLIIDEMENAVVHQDSLITQLMLDKRLGKQRGQTEADGFRVQVYASNEPQVAKNEAQRLYQEMKPQVDVEVYILSEPPFWKVRLGNFLSRDEANAYKQVLTDMFPALRGSTYVVPDKVTIVQ